jgi:hypothetical protein
LFSSTRLGVVSNRSTRTGRVAMKNRFGYGQNGGRIKDSRIALRISASGLRASSGNWKKCNPREAGERG